MQGGRYTKAALDDSDIRWLLEPLSKIDQLPDYLKQEDGKALIPSNLDPRNDIEGWRDAVELGWEAMDREIGVSQALLHQKIAEGQSQDWNEFMKRAETREKKHER